MKVMISQPMSGKSEEMIMAVRNDAIRILESKGYTVVNTFFNEDAPSDSKNPPLFYLGKSLEYMSHCDAVYFCKDWGLNRGCRIEHDAARAYGLTILYEGSLPLDKKIQNGGNTVNPKYEGLEITKVYVHPGGGGFSVQWDAPKLGFGEVTIWLDKEGDKLHVDTECMSDEFVSLVLSKLIKFMQIEG